MTPLRSLALLAPLLLIGCGGTIDAPSLAPRDIEKNEVPVPDEAREPTSTLDAALQTKLQALIDQANAAHASFTAAATKTGATITKAGNAPVGSESWTAAQQELSALDTSRGPLHTIESDIDSLRADPANATPANRGAIEAAAAKVQALADQENATIGTLSGKLKA